MDVGFEKAYERFMAVQIAESTGERRRRLTEGDRYGEKLLARNVWWPLLGTFDRLHAEWEVPDLGRGFRYLDFAYFLPPLRVAIEVEGFGVHTSDRRKFADDHMRAAYLEAEGWKVFRFSVDTVKEHPERIRQVLAILLGKWTGTGAAAGLAFTERERALIRMAIRQQRALTPKAVCEAFGVSDRTARSQLRRLAAKGVLRPAGGVRRVRSYELCSERAELFLGI